MPGVPGTAAEPAPTQGEQYLPADGGAFEPGPHFVRHVTPLEGIRAAAARRRGHLRQGLRRHRRRHHRHRRGRRGRRRRRRGDRVRRRPVGSDARLHRRRSARRHRSGPHRRSSRRSSTPWSRPGHRPSSSSSAAGCTRSRRSPRPCPRSCRRGCRARKAGNAIADVLIGRAEPGGRLPISMPRTVGQVPIHHDHRAGGGRSQFYGDYTDSPSTPLYAFGHGLTYTTFEYARPRRGRVRHHVRTGGAARDGDQRGRPARLRGRAALRARRGRVGRPPPSTARRLHADRARSGRDGHRRLRGAPQPPRLLRRGHALRHRTGHVHLLGRAARPTPPTSQAHRRADRRGHRRTDSGRSWPRPARGSPEPQCVATAG